MNEPAAPTARPACRMCGIVLRDGDQLAMMGDVRVHAGCADPVPDNGSAKRFLQRSGIAAASAMGQGGAGGLDGPRQPS